MNFPATDSSSSSSSLTYFLEDLLRRPDPLDSTLRPFNFIFIFTDESASEAISSSPISPIILLHFRKNVYLMWIPIRIKYDNSISCLQVQSKTSSSGTEQKEEILRVRTVELAKEKLEYFDSLKNVSKNQTEANDPSYNTAETMLLASYDLLLAVLVAGGLTKADVSHKPHTEARAAIAALLTAMYKNSATLR
ncbi:hypothetical protein C0J52_22598 [Blattella germanica]|nr:hypothetical protein C0J52_22598 [Blattella germanica]